MDAPTRVVTTLNHEEPDKVPYFESTVTNDGLARHFGLKPGKLGPALNLIKLMPFKHAVLHRAFSSKNVLSGAMVSLAKLYKAMSIDIMPTISSLFPQKIVKDGFIDEFGRHMHFEYYKDGTEILGYLGGYFKTFEDYQSWEQPDPSWSARLDGFLAGVDAQKKFDDQVLAIGGITGMMEVTWEGFGIEAFSRLLVKRKEIKTVFDDRGKFSNEVVKVLAENGAKLVLIFDDMGFKNGLFMSRKDYRSYVFPWLKQICATAHDRDCKILLHSDGDISDILDDLVDDCKIDALNPIEPMTANPDYSIFKIKEKYGDRLTLVGNVSPVMLATGTILEIEAYTKRLMQECAPGGGYILASGHSINPAVTVDRWQAMLATRDRCGMYPISMN
ncbi:MAG TPA: uroporphyrinogen decarboxylase family protein [Candidatus Lokiarchaeia archaeon]|nr:uroporphyrinogen decarboxylase family protein [Candidatus Lokiarchaeia archaeon]